MTPSLLIRLPSLESMSQDKKGAWGWRGRAESAACAAVVPSNSAGSARPVHTDLLSQAMETGTLMTTRYGLSHAG